MVGGGVNELVTNLLYSIRFEERAGLQVLWGIVSCGVVSGTTTPLHKARNKRVNLERSSLDHALCKEMWKRLCEAEVALDQQHDSYCYPIEQRELRQKRWALITCEWRNLVMNRE